MKITDNLKSLPQYLPSKKTVVKGTYLVVAVAAIAAGATLLGIGGGRLMPHHIARYGAWVLWSTRQAHLVGIRYLAGGSALVTFGTYLIGRYLTHKYESRIANHIAWKIFKLALVVGAIVGGATLFGVGFHHFKQIAWSHKMSGYLLSPSTARYSITKIACGAGLVTLGTLMTADQFLRKPMHRLDPFIKNNQL